METIGKFFFHTIETIGKLERRSPAASGVNELGLLFGVLFIKAPYYIGYLKKEPNLENYPNNPKP